MAFSTVDTDLATYGSQPNYTCIAGYQFPDGNRTKAIVCEDDGLSNNGQWNTTVPDCESRLFNVLFDIEQGIGFSDPTPKQ